MTKDQHQKPERQSGPHNHRSELGQNKQNQSKILFNGQFIDKRSILPLINKKIRIDPDTMLALKDDDEKPRQDSEKWPKPFSAKLKKNVLSALVRLSHSLRQ